MGLENLVSLRSNTLFAHQLIPNKLLFEIFGLYAWYLIQLQQNPGKDFLSVWTVPDRYSCIYGQQERMTYKCELKLGLMTHKLWVLRTEGSWDFDLNKWFQIDKIESIGRHKYVHFFKARQLGLFTRKGSPMLGTSTVGKENFLTLYAIYTVIFDCDYSIWNVFIA